MGRRGLALRWRLVLARRRLALLPRLLLPVFLLSLLHFAGGRTPGRFLLALLLLFTLLELALLLLTLLLFALLVLLTLLLGAMLVLLPQLGGLPFAALLHGLGIPLRLLFAHAPQDIVAFRGITVRRHRLDHAVARIGLRRRPGVGRKRAGRGRRRG